MRYNRKIIYVFISFKTLSPTTVYRLWKTERKNIVCLQIFSVAVMIRIWSLKLENVTKHLFNVIQDYFYLANQASWWCLEVIRMLCTKPPICMWECVQECGQADHSFLKTTAFKKYIKATDCSIVFCNTWLNYKFKIYSILKHSALHKFWHPW